MTFCIHDGTGKITHTATVSLVEEYRAHLVELGSPFTEDDRIDIDPWRFFVDTDTGRVEQRTPMGASASKSTVTADDTDTVQLIGVPAGTKVWMAGQEQGVTDGSPVELSFGVAGVYRITLEHVRHLLQEITVEAVAAN